MKEKSIKSVAVITSTIGRKELERAILSVQAQTYSAKHYVFVDGKQYHQQAREILERYPDVIVTYLPMNTGANGWTNSSINAIAPYLIKEDVFCYLDDDNWYEQTHIEHCVRTLEETNAPYVYALRTFYHSDETLICRDFVESIGFHRNLIQYPLALSIKLGNEESMIVRDSLVRNKTYHIDTNCYAMRRDIALKIAPSWYSGIVNDTNVFKQLCLMKLEGKCTRRFSVNYILDIKKYAGLNKVLKQLSPEQIREFIFESIRYENSVQEKAYEKCPFWLD